jgi:hypothetical protein
MANIFGPSMTDKVYFTATERLYALFNSTNVQKFDQNLPSMIFRLSIWPNGRRESQNVNLQEE